MKNILRATTIYTLVFFSSLSYALPEWKSGYIKRIYIDSSDVVLKIGYKDSGPCGSNLYHIQRNNKNFNELYDMALIAIANNKSVGIQAVECNETRNIINYGYINNH